MCPWRTLLSYLALINELDKVMQSTDMLGHPGAPSLGTDLREQAAHSHKTRRMQVCNCIISNISQMEATQAVIDELMAKQNEVYSRIMFSNK